MQHFDPLFSLYYVKKGFIRPQISALAHSLFRPYRKRLSLVDVSCVLRNLSKLALDLICEQCFTTLCNVIEIHEQRGATGGVRHSNTWV